MLVEAIEKCRRANQPLDYKKQTIRKFIDEYETLMKAESNVKLAASKDQNALSSVVA